MDVAYHIDIRLYEITSNSLTITMAVPTGPFLTHTGTRPPIQETSIPDPYQHLRHFPPDLVEEWIQIRTGNMLPIQEMGQPGPNQDLRQRVPTHMMYGLLQRERGNDEFVRLSRTVTPA